MSRFTQSGDISNRFPRGVRPLQAIGESREEPGHPLHSVSSPPVRTSGGRDGLHGGAAVLHGDGRRRVLHDQERDAQTQQRWGVRIFFRIPVFLGDSELKLFRLTLLFSFQVTWTFQSCPATSCREGEFIRLLKDASSSTTQRPDCGDRCRHWFYWFHWCYSGLCEEACRRDFTQEGSFLLFFLKLNHMGTWISNTDGCNLTFLWFYFTFQNKSRARGDSSPPQKKNWSGVSWNSVWTKFGLTKPQLRWLRASGENWRVLRFLSLCPHKRS